MACIQASLTCSDHTHERGECHAGFRRGILRAELSLNLVAVPAASTVFLGLMSSFVYSPHLWMKPFRLIGTAGLHDFETNRTFCALKQCFRRPVALFARYAVRHGFLHFK